MALAVLLALGVVLRRLPVGRRTVDRALAAIAARRPGPGHWFRNVLPGRRNALPGRSSTPPE